jgi:RimJ/RimL family protein N-acetyltransferase
MLSVYPVTEHDVIEFLKKDLESNESKAIVAEVDGEPAGAASLWWRPVGRDRHVAWLGIDVRTKHWGKGVGSALMPEAIRIAKELGFRKIVLGVFEDNARAMRLYEKSGFVKEAREKAEVWIDGSWRPGLIMSLELAPCKPKLKQSQIKSNTKSHFLAPDAKISIRQLKDGDLDEVNRLQNCTQSTKLCFRVPPFAKEQTKQWYEGIKTQENKYAFAAFSSEKLVGYAMFKAAPPPFLCLRLEEIIVDANQNPYDAATALVTAVKGFRERYSYHTVSTLLPENSYPIINALENQGFKKNGALKDYYFIDEHYTNAAVYGYSNKAKRERAKSPVFPIAPQKTRAILLRPSQSLPTHSSARAPETEMRTTEILKTVTDQEAFRFYEAEGRPTGHSAKKLSDLLENTKSVKLESLIFHTQRGDFQNWADKILKDPKLATELGEISISKSHDLRKDLCKTIENRIREAQQRAPNETVAQA